MMAKAYYTSYKLPIIITRGNNVYGPNQFPEKMIPKFTLLASRGEDLPVHGDGKSCTGVVDASVRCSAHTVVISLPWRLRVKSLYTRAGCLHIVPAVLLWSTIASACALTV